ncbi:methyltransferase domain-containing protein [Candidatus Nomurabacteria bacterium]|nr:methyltransferase domain-containing protein [Candidatus Nomurabacteria bacterium]
MKHLEVLSQIQSDGLFTVEIGAGATPFAGSNLIIDKYPFDNLERAGNISTIAPLIKADAINLPFVDLSVDLLFLSQVIEHIEDPLLFLAEAKRTSKKIYLEWPSPTREVIFGWTFHRWVIEISGSTMTFYKNDLPQLCGGFFHNEYDVFFIQYLEHNHQKFNNYYYGETQDLKFTISDQSALSYLSNKYIKKIDFPEVVGSKKKPATTIIKLMAKAFLKEIFPPEFKQAIKDLLNKKSTNMNDKNVSDLLANKLLCIKCKEVLIDLEKPCKCGFKALKINGIYTFDTDDYK